MASSSAPTNVALQIGIIVLTLVSAVVHLWLAFRSFAFPDPAFILNGLGYLTLLAALYLPIPQAERYRNVVRWVLIGYAALTATLWIAIGLRIPIGYITTTDEVVLILLLLLEARRSRS